MQLRKFSMILGFFVLSIINSFVQAQDVDFSKSYVIPETSGIDTLTVGGITTLWDNATYSVDFWLSPDYNLIIKGALAQSSPSEVLEQRLRNTTWQGIYSVNNDNFTTTLKLVVVQNGYVGGEVIHSEGVETGGGYLHSRVTGDIITQYQINGVFLDQDRISPTELANLSLDTPNRQLVRIKRVRALEFKNDADGSSWSTNREYRVVLENNMLSGSVGIPATSYGEGDETSENGSIVLMLVR
jgi:hypothetical protein